jgi:hypothetical protein
MIDLNKINILYHVFALVQFWQPMEYTCLHPTVGVLLSVAGEQINVSDHGHELFSPISSAKV